MQRHQFEHDGLTLSYLDDGGEGRVLIALHAHWMEALTFVPLAHALAPQWRVIALDQRGHGHSSHAASYTREDYLGDLEALLDHVSIERAVLLGNSLGGANAYQFAARRPEHVVAMVIEEIGAVISDDTSFALAWAGTFKTLEDLEERIGPRFLPYLRDSICETGSGWRLAFDPKDTALSQESLNGDHWSDWTTTSCPALLIRGTESKVTTEAHMEQMVARRPNTRLETLKGGHVVHMDNPQGFEASVRRFLEEF